MDADVRRFWGKCSSVPGLLCYFSVVPAQDTREGSSRNLPKIMFSFGFAGQETRVALPEIIEKLCFLLAGCRQEDKVEERSSAALD